MTITRAGEYWAELVSGSLDEVGIKATPDQVARIASDIEGGHDNYDMAFGYDVASANLSSSKDDVIAELRKDLRDERDKTVCRECNGRGQITLGGPCHVGISQCVGCAGQGRK